MTETNYVICVHAEEAEIKIGKVLKLPDGSAEKRGYLRVVDNPERTISIPRSVSPLLLSPVRRFGRSPLGRGALTRACVHRRRTKRAAADAQSVAPTTRLGGWDRALAVSWRAFEV